ncbi:MAG: aminotransferase class V-fold PLP-dependent enzyme [Acidobacteriota bacterium]
MIYLDNAATSHPKPECVYRTMDRFLREMSANPGRSSHRRATEVVRVIDRARMNLTDLFGGDSPERMIFTLNATDALNLAIKGCLAEGDHVVTTTLEHNSVLRPLHGLERSGKIRVTRVESSPEGYVDPRKVLRELRPDTRMVAMVHASNVLGTVQDLEAIGPEVRGNGSLFLVDAAQSAGIQPIDVKLACIDLLAFTGHKALMGPMGVGGLYVSRRVDPLPWREGGTGGESAPPEQPEEMPTRLEAGTPNSAGIAALAAAVEFLRKEGIDGIREREVGLRNRLVERLAGNRRIRVHAAGSQPVLGTVSLTIGGYEPAEVGAILDQAFGIAVRTGLHCAPGVHRLLGTFPSGTVRLSPGYFTPESEIDTACGALEEIAGRETGKQRNSLTG